MLSTPFKAQGITLSALPPLKQGQGSNLLCPVKVLIIYIKCSAPFRQLEQLFVCFGGHTKGSSVTKQRLSRWIIDSLLWANYVLVPRPGLGLAVCPLQRNVRRPAGPRHPHLPGFIIWKSLPYRHGSFLLNGLICHMTTSMGVCLLLYDNVSQSSSESVQTYLGRLLKAGSTLMNFTICLAKSIQEFV